MKKPTKQSKKQKSGGNKKKYKVRNWKEYNQALIDRGKVLFWITEEAMKNWQEQAQMGKRRRGNPQQYSDTAIQSALILQQVFRLPLRQTGSGVKVYGEGRMEGETARLEQAQDMEETAYRGR